MQSKDFFGVQSILSKITNRKKDSNKNTVSWLRTHEISLSDDAPFVINFKYDLDEQPRIVDIQKRIGKTPIPITELCLTSLSMETRPLDAKKVKDLKYLVSKFVPAAFKKEWEFLDTIKSSGESCEILENLLPGTFDEEMDKGFEYESDESND